MNHIYLKSEPHLAVRRIYLPISLPCILNINATSDMASCRVAFFGLGSTVEHFLEIVPSHPLLSLNDLSNQSPDACRDAIQTYHITVLMYYDQDPDALLWAHDQIRQHRIWHGASLLVLAPVVEEHQNGQPTILQVVPVGIGNPDHAFQLLKLIATATQPRTVVTAAPTSPLPPLPDAARSRPGTPKALRQHRSRTKLSHIPSESQQLKNSPRMHTSHYWQDLQETLKVKHWSCF